MSKPMMKCGHAANAVTADGKPSCVICAGIHPGHNIVDDAPPDLSTRTARCFYYGMVPSRNECSQCRGKDACGCERPSNTDLAFFAHKPDARRVARAAPGDQCRASRTERSVNRSTSGREPLVSVLVFLAGLALGLAAHAIMAAIGRYP